MVVKEGLLGRLSLVLAFPILSIAGTILMHHWMFPTTDGFNFLQWLEGFVVGTLAFYAGAIALVAGGYGLLCLGRYILYDTIDASEIERLKSR
jgi:hypothetical protein